MPAVRCACLRFSIWFGQRRQQDTDPRHVLCVLHLHVVFVLPIGTATDAIRTVGMDGAGLQHGATARRRARNNRHEQRFM